MERRLSPDSSGVAVIAIDGPAASGKSTVARELAKRLGARLIDTGSMYRTATLLALERNVGLDDADTLERISREVSDSYRVSTERSSAFRVFFGDRDVTSEIRSAAVGRAVSEVSAHPGVRKWMVNLQRELAEGSLSVVEGRDIATTVFPGADVKIFLDADFDERVKRRCEELRSKGIEVSHEQVEGEIAERDKIDSSREISPLSKARDSVVIDTTDMPIEEVVERALLLAIDGLGDDFLSKSTR